MSLQLDSEVFLRELGTKEQEKIGEMVQAALQNNMVKIHMALGGMFACKELQRYFKARLDGIERRAQEQEQQRRKRVLRQQRRELARHPIADKLAA